VIIVLEKRGHEVIRSRDVVAAGTPDQVLVILGSYESLVIVTHDRDFRRFRSMLPPGERSRFSKGSGRLQLEVDYAKAPLRVEEEIENIEPHFAQALKRNVPFIMAIMDASIRITTK
jgi:hypothetical protein